MDAHIARSKTDKYCTRTLQFEGNKNHTKTPCTDWGADVTSREGKNKICRQILIGITEQKKNRLFFWFICVDFGVFSFKNLQTFSNKASIWLVPDFHTTAFLCMCILYINEWNKLNGATMKVVDTENVCFRCDCVSLWWSTCDSIVPYSSFDDTYYTSANDYICLFSSCQQSSQLYGD